jgi:iron complex transport system permease protein
MKSHYLLFAFIGLIGLSMTSLFIGVSQVTLTTLWFDPDMRDIFFITRVPRTIALLLAGAAMSVAGLIMQLLTQNRFVEPSLAGTTQSASLGLLVVMVLAPAAPIMVKMIIASLFAMSGTILFMYLLRRIVLKSSLIVPLIGMMLSAVISAITVFAAMYFDLLQSLGAWVNGDFSGILQGRYELLWLVGLFTLLAYCIADSFTVAGMGREFAINLGLNYRKVMFIGLTVIAIVSGIVMVVVGALPFLGLIIPNLVSLIIGDNIRQTIPWVCLCGSGLVVICDIIGRLICYPFEIPASVILGVIGAIIFLFLLIKQPQHAKR